MYITLGEAFNAQQKYTDSELSFQKAEKILVEQKKALQSKVMPAAGDEEQAPDLRIAQAKYVFWQFSFDCQAGAKWCTLQFDVILSLASSIV